MPFPGRTPTNPPLSSLATAAGTAAPPLTSQASQAFAIAVHDRQESELVQAAMEAVASRSPNDAR